MALLMSEIVIAHIVWVLEVLNNKSHQFSRQYVTGIAMALWWSVITTSTVGYGDSVPATALGKLMAVIGLFVGIVITVRAHLSVSLSRSGFSCLAWPGSA